MTKKTIALGCLLASLSLPVAAQDEAAAGIGSEPAVATTPAPDVIAAEPAVIDDGSGGQDAAVEASVAATEVLADNSETPDAGAGDAGAGLNLYVGVEFDTAKVDIDDAPAEAALGASRFDAGFYKLRLGARVFDGVGVEVHAGQGAGDATAGELDVRQFYGLYLVPTGVVLETVEISARLGYAFVELEGTAGRDESDGASFGVAAELPLRVFGMGLPNLRVGVGGTVYQEDRSGRMYGWHGGIRYDFTL